MGWRHPQNNIHFSAKLSEMAMIFVSYSRQNEASAKAIAADIEALGHEAWLDRELTGGHVWWEKILLNVRECDLFLFVLSTEALQSTAARREYEYAAALGKSILPVLVSEGVSLNFLPSALTQIQFVDYRTTDRSSALQLARALIAAPPAGPLPEPLPDPPDVPLSYLNELASRVERETALTYEQQSSMVLDLKRAMREEANRQDARSLLLVFRKRRDLFAHIAEEIDELLKERSTEQAKASAAVAATEPTEFVRKIPTDTPASIPQQTIPAPGPSGDTSSDIKMTEVPTYGSGKSLRNQRLQWASLGFAAGALLGLFTFVVVLRDSNEILFGLIPAVGGAIAGAIAMPVRKRILAALLYGAAAVLVFLQINQSYVDSWAWALVLTAPPVVVLAVALERWALPRLRHSFSFAVWGFLVGLCTGSLVLYDHYGFAIYTLLPATGFAIAAALFRKIPPSIYAAATGAAITALAVGIHAHLGVDTWDYESLIFNYSCGGCQGYLDAEVLPRAVLFGAPPGAVLGALVDRFRWW